MATHTLTFKLTTEEIENLNMALNDALDCRADAINSDCIPESEKIPLLRQCEALDTFTKKIKLMVGGHSDAQ